MMKVLVYNCEDGVAVICPSPESRLSNEDEKEWLMRIFCKDSVEIPPTSNPIILEDTDLPDFMLDAYRVTDGALVADMSIARELWKERLRVARIPKLAALDVAFQRALETGADTSAIVAQKQALRDVTSDPAIEAAQTPDELKQVWPSILDR